MRILEVNYTDLPGRVFNGYELMMELNKQGHEVYQVVREKRSKNKHVIAINRDSIFLKQLNDFEQEYSIDNLLTPFGDKVQKFLDKNRFDVIHCHVLHNEMISLLDYPQLLGRKNVVWTIHDPWILTGNCIHPLECNKWQHGCGMCPRLSEGLIKMPEDNTEFMWKIKQDVLENVNPHIVVASCYMRDYLQASPVTSHFDKIHIIPFGIDVIKYEKYTKREGREYFNFAQDAYVIGFRNNNNSIKGCQYIMSALNDIRETRNIIVVCVGGGTIPREIKEKYQVLSLEWTDDEEILLKFYAACDVFLMPSLAESFGLMAIEAMAAECVVISFQNTVVQEITRAPEIGVSVQYKSSKELREKILYFKDNIKERMRRGYKGRELVKKNFSFKQYCEQHIELYRTIMKEKDNPTRGGSF